MTNDSLNAKPMTPHELREIGERMYGRYWQSKLALALPVTTRTINYWLRGEHPIREVIANRIRDLADR